MASMLYTCIAYDKYMYILRHLRKAKQRYTNQIPRQQTFKEKLLPQVTFSILGWRQLSWLSSNLLYKPTRQGKVYTCKWGAVHHHMKQHAILHNVHVHVQCTCPPITGTQCWCTLLPPHLLHLFILPPSLPPPPPFFTSSLHLPMRTKVPYWKLSFRTTGS